MAPANGVDAFVTESTVNRPTVGLVLGAGGIRGCAHAGVIKVLRDANVPIDLIVGASVGSVFGLGLASGTPLEYITRVAREATPQQMFRFYAGRLRPTGKDPIARMLWTAGHDKTFADLEIPLAVRVTDIATGQPTIINQGPVLPAVQASIALPFIARPVGLDGAFYLDGGFFDTAPVSTARQMGADIVIAVCLGYNYMTPAIFQRRPWTQPVLTRLGRQRRPVRGTLLDQVRFTSRLLAASYNPVRPCVDADIAIWPDCGTLGPNSMGGAAFAFYRGIQAARVALPTIQQHIQLGHTGSQVTGSDQSAPTDEHSCSNSGRSLVAQPGSDSGRLREFELNGG